MPGEIFQAQFESAELGMIVVLECECNVDGVAHKETFLRTTFCHPPSQGVPFSTDIPIASVGKAKLNVFILDGFRGQKQLRISRYKDRLWITHSEGLQLRDALKQTWPDLFPSNFRIDFENRYEVGFGESFTSIGVEVGPQCLNPLAGQCQSDGMGVATKAIKQFAA